MADDKKADQGKALYKKGKTITDNNSKLMITEAAVSVGSVVANKVLSTYADQSVANLSSAAIMAGGSAVNLLVWGKTQSENKKLRAYYAH